MTTEINVISRTQIILVDPTSGSVSVINAGPPGPAGPGGGSNTGTVIPPGMIMPFAPDGAAPTGWLLCNGAVYPNGAYPALAAVLRNIYGGDGVTTFAVPDLRGKTIFGQNPTVPPFNVFGKSGGVLNHNHPLDSNGFARISIGAVSSTDSFKAASVNTPNWNATFGNKTVLSWGGPANANANRGVPLWGTTADAVNVLPPHVVMSYLIKT